jgi:diketogulonate reductase-like aldo/keto reductase
VQQGRIHRPALDRSLQKLGTDYVDLYLIHSPFWAGDISNPAERESAAKALQERWAEMEAAKASGKVRSIGVSNFLKEHLDAILETAKEKPVVNQIEFHPYLQHDPEGNGGLLAYLKEKGIVAEAYGPLTAVAKAAPGPLDGVYERIAAKHGVTPGDVALRWAIDQGVVAVTTSAKEERLKGWIKNVPSFELTKEEVEEIKAKGREKHFRGFWNNKFADDDRR